MKGLAEEDEEEESASQWVLRMREIQKEKELAQKRVCVYAASSPRVCCCGGG